MSHECVLQTLVPRTLLVMHIPPKARSIPASDRETSATLWVNRMSAYTGRLIGACVCFAPAPIAMLVLASGGCASRRSYTQELHSTAPPRPDERPGQGRSSSRKCDMGYTSNIYLFIFIERSVPCHFLVKGTKWSKWTKYCRTTRFAFAALTAPDITR